MGFEGECVVFVSTARWSVSHYATHKLPLWDGDPRDQQKLHHVSCFVPYVCACACACALEEAPVEEAASLTRVCSKCKAKESDPEAVFCPMCGHHLVGFDYAGGYNAQELSFSHFRG